MVLRMYVNLCFVPIEEATDAEERTVLLTYAAEDGVESECFAYLMEGGQRLLLPEDAADQIIDILLEGGIVKL